eukprot:9516545-Alexandrium_andersonii.AAC.1
MHNSEQNPRNAIPPERESAVQSRRSRTFAHAPPVTQALPRAAEQRASARHGGAARPPPLPAPARPCRRGAPCRAESGTFEEPRRT